jgi:hypothetical protein
MPCTASTSGGFESTTVFFPVGAPDLSTSVTGIPMIFSASSFGLPIVAEHMMNTGSDP